VPRGRLLTLRLNDHFTDDRLRFEHPGRQEFPANLPRLERILPCAPDQRVCKRCGKETVVFGYEESSQLDLEPAKYFVLVTAASAEHDSGKRYRLENRPSNAGRLGPQSGRVADSDGRRPCFSYR
jgi:hypothetical protein